MGKFMGLKSSDHYASEAIKPFAGKALEIYNDALLHEKDYKIRLVFQAFIDPVRTEVEHKIRSAMTAAYLAGFQAATNRVRNMMPEDIPINHRSREHHYYVVAALGGQSDAEILATSGVR